MSEESRRILQLRRAEGAPVVQANPTISWNGSRYEVQMSTEGSQEEQLLIGAPVSVDEHGRLGTHGNPIGIIVHVDRDNHQARISIEPGTPLNTVRSLNPMRVNEFPYPLSDPTEWVAQRQIRADEDARILEALDAIANDSTPGRKLQSEKPKQVPKSRSIFKTRYQRIREGFEK
jgi:hypothetical protein